MQYGQITTHALQLVLCKPRLLEVIFLILHCIYEDVAFLHYIVFTLYPISMIESTFYSDDTNVLAGGHCALPPLRP